MQEGPRSAWSSRQPSTENPPASAADRRDSGSIPGPGRSPEVGNGNPLQFSCLENPTDGGAWQATVSGVSESQTRTQSPGGQEAALLAEASRCHRSLGTCTDPFRLTFSSRRSGLAPRRAHAAHGPEGRPLPATPSAHALSHSDAAQSLQPNPVLPAAPCLWPFGKAHGPFSQPAHITDCRQVHEEEEDP